MFVGFIKQSFINFFGVSEVMETEITIVNRTFSSSKELFENTWTAKTAQSRSYFFLISLKINIYLTKMSLFIYLLKINFTLFFVNCYKTNNNMN